MQKCSLYPNSIIILQKDLFYSSNHYTFYAISNLPKIKIQKKAKYASLPHLCMIWLHFLIHDLALNRVQEFLSALQFLEISRVDAECVFLLSVKHTKINHSIKAEYMFTVVSFHSFLSFSLQQNKEEVMAVRLREADNIAAMAELQQQISELEIQVQISKESHSISPIMSYTAQPSTSQHSLSAQYMTVVSPQQSCLVPFHSIAFFSFLVSRIPVRYYFLKT